jgi:hypothetical protein
LELISESEKSRDTDKKIQPSKADQDGSDVEIEDF